MDDVAGNIRQALPSAALTGFSGFLSVIWSNSFSALNSQSLPRVRFSQLNLSIFEVILGSKVG